MTWRQPEYFALLAVVAALAVALIYALRQRRAALRQFADDSLVARLARGVSERRRAARLALRVVALAIAVVALAGPKWGFHWEEVHREGIDLIVAIDTSRSMLATDVVPNRLERAKLAVLDLLPRLQGDRIGLVAYAGTAFLEAPLTLDYAAFARSLRALQVGIIPRGGTSLSRAIETSLAGFEARQGKYEALILISDGEENEGDAVEAAKQAAERGVKVYTVGIGTPEGELLPLPREGAGSNGYVKDRKGQVVKSRLNETLLKDVALETGGAYVRGLGPQLGLDQVFDDHIARMERREVDSGLQRRSEERFQIPLLLAILLLFVETALGDRTRPPLPERGRAWFGRLARWRRRGAATAALAIVLLPAASARAGVFDREPHPVNQGVAAFEKGEYEEAVSRFGEALVESPASPLLQFDLAAALYKQGRFEESIAPLEKVAGEGGEEWSGRANYNLGNVQFRIGAASEETDPQKTLERWGQALLAYRRAMAADPQSEEAKFNYELVQRRIEELQKRLEEEQQEQEEEQDQQQEEEQKQEEQEQQPEQQQEDQQEQQQEQQEQQQEQQQNEEQQEQQQQDEQQQQPPQPQDGEQQEGQEEQAPQEEQQQAQDQPPEEEPQQGGGEQAQPEPPSEEAQQEAAGGAAAGEASEEQRAAEQAAQVVLDVARQEELGPEEIGRPAAAAGIGEPASDW